MRKPPIGLMPKKTHQEIRFNEVYAAISRYYNAGIKIPIEWIKEYNDLVGQIPSALQYGLDKNLNIRDKLIPGYWYWVKIEDSWTPAKYAPNAAGGWTNTDTWEDFDGQVSNWILIKRPGESNMTLKELKDQIKELEAQGVTDDAKIMTFDKMDYLVNWDGLTINTKDILFV